MRAWRLARIGALAEDKQPCRPIAGEQERDSEVAGATGSSETEGVAWRATTIGCEAEGGWPAAGAVGGVPRAELKCARCGQARSMAARGALLRPT